MSHVVASFLQAIYGDVMCREPRWDFLLLAEGLLITLEVAKMVFLFLRQMEKSRDLDEVCC
jgi:hypothetical protein